MKPTVSVVKTSNSKNLQTRLNQIGKKAAYVGIPSTTASARRAQLSKMAGNLSGTSKESRKKKDRLVKLAASEVNNAELLYVFSKGSPANHQPPRPVIEPAIEAPGNREAISHELGLATKATLQGNEIEATGRLKRAGLAGQNASRQWFRDSRNGWEPNAERTILAKGSDRPGIDSGAMRDSIIYVVKEDNSS